MSRASCGPRLVHETHRSVRVGFLGATHSRLGRVLSCAKVQNIDYECPQYLEDNTAVVDRSLPCSPLDSVDAVVSVCTHKHCCKRGALDVLRALKEDAAKAEGLTIDVRCSSCLGQCKKGPSVHVALSSGEEIVAVKVESGHDVQQLAAVAMFQ